MSISTQIITFDFKLFLGNAIKSLSIDLIKIKARPTAVTLTLRQAIPLPSNKRLKQFFHHKQLTYFTAALEWSDPETDFQSVLSVINTQEEPLSISDLIKHENAIQDACFYRDKIIIIMSNDWSCCTMNIYSLDGELIRSWDLPSRFNSVTIAGDHIVVLSGDGDIHIYSETGEVIRSITLHRLVECEECGQEIDDVGAMKEVDDKSILLICDSTIRRFNLSTKQVMWRYTHDKDIIDAVYDGHGNIICMDRCGDLITLDVTSGKFKI